MVSISPAEALGSHACATRALLVKVIQSRHRSAEEAHLVSGSRYSAGFGTQWRDLLDDVYEEFVLRGYQSQKMSPAGYRLPVVNDCLIYVWRVSSAPDAVTGFASSATRRNSFFTQSPAPMLFEPGFGEESDHDKGPGNAEVSDNERLVRAMDCSMPVVLVMVRSLPRQLQLIEWAVAELYGNGKVKLHGCETIWKPETDAESAVSDVEAFDHGTPVEPVVEPREQEGIGPDAR